MSTELLIGLAVALLVLLGLLKASIHILDEYERGVLFRLGRVTGEPKGPGLILIIPIIDKLRRVSLRTLTMDIPPQDIITRDNVTVRVNAVTYFRVLDPNKAVLEIEDFRFATSQIAQTTLRSIIGQADLDGLLVNRDEINRQLQQIIDDLTNPVGSQGEPGRGERCRAPGCDAAGDGPSGRGRARPASQGHPCPR
jgi:regulator of protease activity HflC (stomatin/prohibitin superfamily)